jgi:lysozyme family protein
VGGKVVRRTPTHIATTSDPARAGTVLVETNASGTGGVNRYVQETVPVDFPIQTIDEPAEMASTTPLTTPAGGTQATTLAPRAADVIARFGDEQVDAAVSRALAAKEHEREFHDLKRRNAEMEAQFKAMQSAAAADQVSRAPVAPAGSAAAGSQNDALKIMDERFKALEDLVKSSGAAKKPDSAPVPAASAVTIAQKPPSKEEPTDDPSEPSPVRKSAAKRGAPDVAHNRDLDTHYRSTYGAYTPDEIDRMRQVASNERVPDASDGALFSRLLNDCIKGRDMVDKIDSERFTVAARLMLGDDADEDEINSQVDVFRRSPSVYDRWMARNGGSVAAPGRAVSFASAFPGSGHGARVTEVAANASSAIKAQQQQQQQKPTVKTNEAPAFVGVKGFFTVGQ